MTNVKTNTATATVYDAEKLAKLEKSVARINRKLAKAGLDSVQLDVAKALRTWQITVTYPTFEELGWQVQAVVKSAPETGSYHHVLRGQPDAIPQRYWDAPMMCEHCGAERRRKTTVIVRHQDDGRWMQVGSTCVADFLGGGAGKIVAGLKALDRVRADVAEAEVMGDQTSDYALYFEPEVVLGATMQHLMDNGGKFVPTGGSQALAAPESTACAVAEKLLDAALAGNGFDHLMSERASVATMKCLAWFSEHLTDTARARDSYLRNLETATRNTVSPSFTANDSGFALLCSLPNYWREQVRGPQQAAQPTRPNGRIDTSNSQHLAYPGRHVAAGNARVLYVRELAPSRGTKRTLVIFATHSGNVVSWLAWGGAASGLQAGHDLADLEGVVLRHDYRNGERQTMLRNVHWGCLLSA